MSHRAPAGVHPLLRDVLHARVFPFGFDDLVNRMLAERIPIGAFRHDGTWIDIGRIDELRRAQKEAAGQLTGSSIGAP